MARSKIKWPFDCLAKAVGGRSNKELAALLGTNVGQIKYMKIKGVSDNSADRLAVRIGLHPASIWPDWFDRSTEG